MGRVRFYKIKEAIESKRSKLVPVKDFKLSAQNKEILKRYPNRVGYEIKNGSSRKYGGTLWHLLKVTYRVENEERIEAFLTFKMDDVFYVPLDMKANNKLIEEFFPTLFKHIYVVPPEEFKDLELSNYLKTTLSPQLQIHHAKMIKKLKKGVRFWVGLYASRRNIGRFSMSHPSNVASISALAGALGEYLSELKIGLVVFDWCDARLDRAKKRLQIANGAVYFPEGESEVTIKNVEPSAKFKYKGRFLSLDLPRVRLKPFIVLFKRKIMPLGETAIFHSRPTVGNIVEKGLKDPYRKRYWNNVKTFCKQLGLNDDSVAYDVDRKIFSFCRRNRIPVLTSFESQELAADKYLTANKLFGWLEKYKIYGPPSIIATQVNEVVLAKVVYETLYLIEAPKYLLVLKDRFGSMGSAIEFVYKEDDIYKAKIVTVGGGVEKKEIGDFSELVAYINYHGEKYIAQPFIPPANVRGDNYDIRIVIVGPESLPMVYIRSSDFLVPNLKQNGRAFSVKAFFGKSYKEYEDMIYRDAAFAYKVMRTYLKSTLPVPKHTPYSFAIHELQRINKMLYLVGVDLAYFNTRSDIVSDDIVTQFIPPLVLKEIKKEDDFLDRIESWRELGSENMPFGSVPIVYEINTNPGMVGPLSLPINSKERGYLTRRIAESLSLELHELGRRRGFTLE